MLLLWTPLAFAVLWCVFCAIRGGLLRRSKSDRRVSNLSTGRRTGPDPHLQFDGYADESLSEPQNLLECPKRSLSRASVVHVIGNIESIHIVCVGKCRPQHFIYNEILDIPGFTVSTVLDYRELSTAVLDMPAIVLTHDSRGAIEMEDTCRFVRRKWPISRILVIHDGEDFLEDALYDDRVGSDIVGKDLMIRILFLVQTLDVWGPHIGRKITGN